MRKVTRSIHEGARDFARDIAQEIRRKTRRGLEGVVRVTDGRVYGYAIRREIDAAGEPIRGLRDIVPTEAEIVVEIFRKYAAGASPRAIAADLNARGVGSPRGGTWNASTINGNADRGNGVIHNELYRGALVFGRQTWLKVRARHWRRFARSICSAASWNPTWPKPSAGRSD